MSVVRSLIIIVLAVPVGAVAGMFYANQKAAEPLAALQESNEKLKAEQKTLADRAREAESKAEALEREKRHLEDQLASAAKPQSTDTARLEAVGAPTDTLFTDEPAEGDAAVPDDRRRGDDDDENDPEREARIAQWREEREQRGAEMRQRLDEFMQNEIQNAPDKASQERLAAMNEYSHAMMDLYQQMRNAETDEERDLIREQMRENGTAARELVRQHQEHLMRQSLAQSGVTDPRAQEAAMQSLRQTMEGPFFRGPMAGMGSWGGGDRGRGGWGDRDR